MLLVPFIALYFIVALYVMHYLNSIYFDAKLIDNVNVIKNGFNSIDINVNYYNYCYSFQNINHNGCTIKSKDHCRWKLEYCKYDYKNTCSLNYGNALLEYKYDVNIHNDLINKSSFIGKLKYLVISGHGGVLIDTLSYLVNAINIPRDNIGYVCVWAYCGRMRKYINLYQNNGLRQFFKILEDMVDPRKMNKEFVFSNNIEKYQNILKEKVFDKLGNNDNKMDVIMCLFPSFNCVLLFPFAKVMIIKFSHRFDHHINWDIVRIKWAKILHYSSIKCIFCSIL